MSQDKVKRNLLRQRAAAVGIFSIAELARRVGCSREAIYFSIEKPTRFPHVTKRLNKLVGINHD
jgi:hypothetical protein